MKFYEIDNALLECVNPETGEVDAERFDVLQGERKKKIESIALWTLELAAEEEALNTEIDRLTAKRNAIRNKRKSLKEFLCCNLNVEKFKTPLVSISLRQTKSVVVDDIYRLPGEFVKTELKADKNALLNAFDEWQTIAGAHIETKTSVTVR